jgi:hypothetical protein
LTIVAEAANGADALALFAAHRPDLAFLEYLVAFACLGWAMFMLKRRMRRAPVHSSPTATALTFSGKVSRLATRLREPQWRQYGMLVLAGKALGIAVLFGIIFVGTTLVHGIRHGGSGGARRRLPIRKTAIMGD